jgi:hypothetical protein
MESILRAYGVILKNWKKQEDKGHRERLCLSLCVAISFWILLSKEKRDCHGRPTA